MGHSEFAYAASAGSLGARVCGVGGLGGLSAWAGASSLASGARAAAGSGGAAQGPGGGLLWRSGSAAVAAPVSGYVLFISHHVLRIDTVHVPYACPSKEQRYSTFVSYLFG